MHGIVPFQLKKFIMENYGNQTWYDVLNAANISSNIFLPSKIYEDKIIVDLVTAICQVLSISQSVALHAFGKFIAVPLTEIYHPLIRKEWSAIDLIENTEEVIHKVVRMKMPGAKPPNLITTRSSQSEILISYSSEKKMCDLLKGIAVGLGEYYKEPLETHEESCMLNGNTTCEILVKNSTETLEEKIVEDEPVIKTIQSDGKEHLETEERKNKPWYRFW